jgi:hypothetical protein
MDGIRFDRWTRLVGAGVSRRHALRGLTTAMLAGATVGSASPAAARACQGPERSCNRNGDCCQGLTCTNGSCAYERNCGGRRNDFCDRDSDCCNNWFCCESECQRCRGYACSRNGDCCPGFRCRNGKCK